MATRKCIHCSEFIRDKTDKECIGQCQKYERRVIDALCGCEEKKGEIILWNFEVTKKEA